MVSDLLAFDGMKVLLVFLEMWYSSFASWNLTSVYVRTEIYINLFHYICQLLINFSKGS